MITCEITHIPGRCTRCGNVTMECSHKISFSLATLSLSKTFNTLTSNSPKLHRLWGAYERVWLVRSCPQQGRLEEENEIRSIEWSLREEKRPPIDVRRRCHLRYPNIVTCHFFHPWSFIPNSFGLLSASPFIESALLFIQFWLKYNQIDNVVHCLSSGGGLTIFSVRIL